MTAVAPAAVHDSDRTRVTRLTVRGQTVIRKQPLGRDAPRRLRHEGGMLERLRGVEGVARLVDGPPDRDSIVMEDAGRRSLVELAKPVGTRDGSLAFQAGYAGGLTCARCRRSARSSSASVSSRLRR